jgi:hypothetical protein
MFASTLKRASGRRILCTMKPLQFALLLAALLPGLLCSAPAVAQSSPAAARLSQSQSERMAVDLRQGMTLEEVQKLLGKPRRTALRSSGGGPTDGSLQWTYSWSSNGNSEKSLQVIFASKTPERWTVTSWDWNSY